MFRAILICLSFLVTAPSPLQADELVYDAPSEQRDAWVDACLSEEGIRMLEGTDVLCYHSAIFPEQFLKLNSFPSASQIIITSPGGNVATARGMSTILDRRAEPAIIAGPCMSACAMVILPGLDQVHIHHTAHIAVHGITHMDYRTWFGWLKGAAEPSSWDLMRAQLGYDFKFVMHHSLAEHVEAHLSGQGTEIGFIQAVDENMLAAAQPHACKVDPKNYWGMLTGPHLREFLGTRLTGMEAFAQSWDDPNNLYYRDVIEPIGPRTYVFSDDYAAAVCS